MLNMLVQASELLIANEPSRLATIIHRSALRLASEVDLQRCLSETTGSSYQPMWDRFTVKQVFEELKMFFTNHPAARDKRIVFANIYPNFSFTTDISLLLRVLCNMVINALEATERDQAIRVWCEHKEDRLKFCVWNAQAVPPDIAKRIFQRNFSTKAQSGRGVGTYSMKLFGEKILGGDVSFTSSSVDGTVFRFTHHLL
jgi:signal transduction histidine kinase